MLSLSTIPWNGAAIRYSRFFIHTGFFSFLEKQEMSFIILIASDRVLPAWERILGPVNLNTLTGHDLEGWRLAVKRRFSYALDLEETPKALQKLKEYLERSLTAGERVELWQLWMGEPLEGWPGPKPHMFHLTGKDIEEALSGMDEFLRSRPAPALRRHVALAELNTETLAFLLAGDRDVVCVTVER